MSVRRVAAEIPLGVEPARGDTFITGGSLSYDIGNPFEVILTVKGEPGEQSVEWRLSRQLLASGLVSMHGEGDVRIGPDPDSYGRLVMIELNPPDGHAVLRAGMSAVQRFLSETYDLVPEGGEDLDMDLDAELAKLLADGS